MKCPCCKYEYEESYDGGTLKVVVGNEKFLRIGFLNKPFETDKDIGGYYTEYMAVYLYGCPKCKTIQYDNTF